MIGTSVMKELNNCPISLAMTSNLTQLTLIYVGFLHFINLWLCLMGVKFPMFFHEQKLVFIFL